MVREIKDTKKKRRRHPVDEKVSILRRHLADKVPDFVTAFAGKTELSVIKVVAWLGLAKGKFYSWKQRYGRVNEHNASVPRDHWIEDWERDAIVEFHGKYPLEGYRRRAFMML